MAYEYSEKYTQENQAYKSIIREYVKSKLLDPLRMYPTTISDTLIYIITARLEELYLYTVRFPEIVSPDTNRLDILQAIVDQFEYTLREGSDIEEQVDILENILYVYNKRGSIDTIENMWKYYGGNLPKDIKVKIPSSNIFRYNLSRLSGSDVFQDGETYRSGVYEVVLNNSTYSIPTLKEFMLNELVAAGNRIFFTNSMYSLLTGESSSYEYSVKEDTFVHKHLRTVSQRSGMNWSGLGALSNKDQSTIWSGRADMFLELTNMLSLDLDDPYPYIPQDILVTLISQGNGFGIDIYDRVSLLTVSQGDILTLLSNIQLSNELEIMSTASYTPLGVIHSIDRYLYDSSGNLVTNEYPGYFVLGKTLLGNEV